LLIPFKKRVYGPLSAGAGHILSGLREAHIKGGVKGVEVLCIQMVLRDAQCFTEANRVEWKKGGADGLFLGSLNFIALSRFSACLCRRMILPVRQLFLRRGSKRKGT
jgi:hypothetical protein